MSHLTLIGGLILTGEEEGGGRASKDRKAQLTEDMVEIAIIISGL